MPSRRSEPMSALTTLRPSTVGKLNERQVLRLIQTGGSRTRAEVARESGLSAPTVSKAVASLLAAGFLEEVDATEAARGRPAPRLRLNTTSAQVLGVSVDAGHCEVVSAGLDGELHADMQSVPTPTNYRKLIDALEATAREMMDRPGVTTLGVGLSLPGLVDYRQGKGVLSPNVPMTNGHAPAADLAARLGVDCVMLQEAHALTLAERYFGQAKGVDDFAMLDVGVGVGLGVMCGGHILKGHSGTAGEIGHITADPAGGVPCGCGNSGCLETLASDAALARRVSARLGRRVQVDDLIAQVKAGTLDITADLAETARYLAIAVGAVINLFNPAAVFIHSRLFEVAPDLFPRVVELAKRRSLPPPFADCTIVPARGSKRQGAVAGIIQHLTNAVAPELA